MQYSECQLALMLRAGALQNCVLLLILEAQHSKVGRCVALLYIFKMNRGYFLTSSEFLVLHWMMSKTMLQDFCFITELTLMLETNWDVRRMATACRKCWPVIRMIWTSCWRGRHYRLLEDNSFRKKLQGYVCWPFCSYSFSLLQMIILLLQRQTKKSSPALMSFPMNPRRRQWWKKAQPEFEL